MFLNVDLFRHIDANIADRCKLDELHLRNAGNGLWVCVLVPLALLSGIGHFAEWSELYTTVSLISIGLLVSSCCSILHRDSRSSDSGNVPFIQIGYILSSTVVSLLLIFVINRGVIYSLSIALATSFAYHPIHQTLIKCCPNSFTWGEASLIAQSLILYLSSFVVKIFLSLQRTTSKSCGDSATVVVQSGFFAVLITLLLAYYFRNCMSNVFIFLAALITSAVIFVVALPRVIFNINSILWLFNLISDRNSMILISLWLLCSIIAVLCLLWQIRSSTPVTTVTRKSFHLLIFLVIVPGTVWSPCLLYTASNVGFALMIIIEMCRKLNFSRYGEWLQECFDTFKDEKDEGELALTPLYLMIGCSAPIWIYPLSYSVPVPLPVLAGIFPVAVGDAAASVGGTLLGKHKWKGSNKTIEGSVFCFVSQLIVFGTFALFGIIEMSYVSWASVVFIITSVIEAKTDQIDNVVLPFITYILFMIVT
ncbi:dolichol kinase-like [Planococcus citri]|uniref:dolichol kinase-like n=1 Tax=Planococcus citri TaxID=170843 RepID=UPI0031F9D736